MVNPCIREALCPQLWIGDLAKLLNNERCQVAGSCREKIHLSNLPVATVFEQTAMMQHFLAEWALLYKWTGTLSLNHIRSTNPSLLWASSSFETWKNFVESSSSPRTAHEITSKTRRFRLEFQGAPEGLCFRRHSYPRGHWSHPIKPIGVPPNHPF